MERRTSAGVLTSGLQTRIRLGNPLAFMSPPAKCAAYLLSLCLTMGRYNMCVTRERRLALVPASAVTGDEIVVLHGCCAPFVVQPQRMGRYFILFGEAYVHRVMDREVVKDSTLKEERITLKRQLAWQHEERYESTTSADSTYHTCNT